MKVHSWLSEAGRIINRFSSDVYGIDDSLPFIMNILFAQVGKIFLCDLTMGRPGLWVVGHCCGGNIRVTEVRSVSFTPDSLVLSRAGSRLMCSTPDQLLRNTTGRLPAKSKDCNLSRDLQFTNIFRKP